MESIAAFLDDEVGGHGTEAVEVLSNEDYFGLEVEEDRLGFIAIVHGAAKVDWDDALATQGAVDLEFADDGGGRERLG